jgi:hypothetical protein
VNGIKKHDLNVWNARNIELLLELGHGGTVVALGLDSGAICCSDKLQATGTNGIYELKYDKVVPCFISSKIFVVSNVPMRFP